MVSHRDRVNHGPPPAALSAAARRDIRRVATGPVGRRDLPDRHAEREARPGRRRARRRVWASERTVRLTTTERTSERAVTGIRGVLGTGGLSRAAAAGQG